ncbi:MAG: hypothetical protein WCE24_23590, partial [Pseudolabrys sp.]
ASTSGTFIWYDDDAKAAAAFYSDVIGWDAQEHQILTTASTRSSPKAPTMVAGLVGDPSQPSDFDRRVTA